MWAQFWVSERPGVPDTATFAFYILGLGLLVPLAHIVMDRMGHLPHPPTWVLWVAPGFAALIWAIQTVAEANPMRLILPLMLGLILWVMARLGQRGAQLSPWGPARRRGTPCS